jgi:hypothetical protein
MKSINSILIALVLLQIAFGKTEYSERIAGGSSSQSKATPAPKPYPNAKTQANQLNDAVLSGDYAKAADLTYPKLVELIGGRAEYLAVLEAGMKETQSDGFRIISSVTGDPKDVIEDGNVVYAILPTTMRIKVAEGVLVGQTFLIGVSNDRGEHWTFLDVGNGSSHELVKTLFPAVADRLKLPERKPLVLQPAQ